jgi:hypothetical protein
MFGWFKKSPESLAAEAEVANLEPLGVVRSRHAARLARAKQLGLDPGTLLLLLQFFGPLLVALLDRLLSRLDATKPTFRA